MKKSAFRLIALLSLIVPMFAAAQNNIVSAFDAIIKCRDAQIVETHSLSKDPRTHAKTGQSDVYRFVLPADKIKLVKNVVSAIEADSEQAYSLNRGQTVQSDDEIFLAVGDGRSESVQVNDAEGEYIYAAFLAPVTEDPQGNYRYAYAMSYREDGDCITGKLIVTYAMTLQYRQQLEKQRQHELFFGNSAGLSSTVSVSTPTQSWFDSMMTYFQSMPSANSQTRIALATKAYKKIQDMADYDVTESEKDTVREILKGLLTDKEYSETVLNNLLNMCLVGIK